MHKLCNYFICQGLEQLFQLLYKLALLYSCKLNINIYTLKAFVQTLFDLANNYILDNPGQVVFFFAVRNCVCMYVNTMDSDSKRNCDTLEHDPLQHVRHFALLSPNNILPSPSPFCAFIPANKNLAPVSKCHIFYI